MDEELEATIRKRIDYLYRLYKTTKANTLTRCAGGDLGIEMGLVLEETDGIVRYLRDQGWVATGGGGYISITHPGILEVERQLSRADEPKKHLPAGNITRNNLPVFKTTFETYRATEFIGQGGSGKVYRVQDDSGQPFAVKILDVAHTTHEKRKRFKNELLFCQRNQHRNIISVVDNGILLDRDESPFYVMQLYESSLRALLKAGLLPDKVLGYFGQILDGVEAAHLQKIVHRDLKPENILFDSKASQFVVADFGIAHFEEEALFTSVETSTSERLANFQYAAPEQRGRGLRVDLRADIYALGLILNEMFTGEVPLGTGYKTIANVAPAYGYLDDIVFAMLSQSPHERPGSVDAVKQQLIGHRQEFISRQRLSELRQTVVPVTDLDDPLIVDPPRLVNCDYDRGVLTLFFQRPLTDKWVWALHNMGSHSFLAGKGPENFRISGNQASIPAREDEVQEVIDYFKVWLPSVNRLYEQRIRQEKLDTERLERERLQHEIDEEERRQRVLRNVKI